MAGHYQFNRTKFFLQRENSTSSPGAGTVNAALNGVSLRDPQTVVLGGNPLDANTFIEGDGFDLLLGTVSALNDFKIGYAGSLVNDSTPSGGDVIQSLSQTQEQIIIDDGIEKLTNFRNKSSDLSFFENIASGAFSQRFQDINDFDFTLTDNSQYTSNLFIQLGSQTRIITDNTAVKETADLLEPDTWFAQNTDNGIVNELRILSDSIGGFTQVRSDSGFGLREFADYSANYVGLNLTNKIYTDGNASGLNITNAPAAVGDVMAFNGIDITWQPQSGGGGGGLKADESFPIGSIDAGSASANQVYSVKFICKADIDITMLSAFITSAGADTMYVSVSDSAKALLVQGTLTGAGTGVKSTLAFPAVSLTGGAVYWLSIKGNLGSTNFGQQPCFASADIALSQFFGGVGIPDPLAGAGNNFSPYISISA